MLDFIYYVDTVPNGVERCAVRTFVRLSVTKCTGNKRSDLEAPFFADDDGRNSPVKCHRVRVCVCLCVCVFVCVRESARVHAYVRFHSFCNRIKRLYHIKVGPLHSDSGSRQNHSDPIDRIISVGSITRAETFLHANINVGCMVHTKSTPIQFIRLAFAL